MAEVLLFHHAQGLTAGCLAFAGELRAVGHLVHSCVPPSEFGGPWPDGVPLQIHMMDADEWALPPNEDLDAARALDRTVEATELFLYPGDRHLFADDSLPAYDEGAATLLKRRVLSFLEATSTPEA
jgi:dienelactone hydrolase